MSPSSPKVTALSGSYRIGGVIDQAVDEILAAASAGGAVTRKISLIDEDVAFCTNCRSCSQAPGDEPGVCVLDDGFKAIFDELRASDALVLASPMNFSTVTAVMKRFIERLICMAYWPWGKWAPSIRPHKRDKPTIIVCSSAAPAVLIRPLTKMVSLMKSAAGILGAGKIHVLFVGFAASAPDQKLNERTKRKARQLGHKLLPRG